MGGTQNSERIKECKLSGIKNGQYPGEYIRQKKSSTVFAEP